MKQVIQKYNDILLVLEGLGIDSFTKVNLKRCLAVYANGEILKAFHAYMEQSQEKISPDMIAFFYLHLQMSGAASECLNRSFAYNSPNLRKVLFDTTPSGKDAVRLSRFAGAHSNSLTALLNSFSSTLLKDYMRILEEVLPVVKQCILSHAPSLKNKLSKKVKIDFAPMQAIDCSSVSFRVCTSKKDAGLLLESIKAIDMVASILADGQRDNFLKSDQGQAMVIMARQIFANNIHELVRSGVLSGNADCTELRQYRNCSAHSFVMWEIQNNPVKLRSNSIRLVLGMRQTLLDQLDTIAPAVYTRYVNPKKLEEKTEDRSEEDQTESTLEESSSQSQVTKRKLPKSVTMHTYEFEDGELLGNRAKQAQMMRELIGKIVQFNNKYNSQLILPMGQTEATDTPMKRVDPMELLPTILPSLEKIHALIPGAFIEGINAPLTATAKGKPILGISNAGESLLACSMKVETQDLRMSFEVTFLAKKAMYITGFKEVKLYFVGQLLKLFECRADLLNSRKNLTLFIATLQRAFDLGASPYVMLQIDSGLQDILSFAIASNFPKEVIFLLLDNNASVNQIVENQTYLGPLHCAARSKPEILQALLDVGANPIDILHDSSVALPITSNIFYDIFAAFDISVKLRLASLTILYPFIYQKYGREALLANMNFPTKFYLNPRLRASLNWDGTQAMDTYYEAIRNVELNCVVAILHNKKSGKLPDCSTKEGVIQLVQLGTFETCITANYTSLSTASFFKARKDSILQCVLLHQKVETVLSNPRFSFYQLILNNELEIMVNEIDRLCSPEMILEAMGITDEGTETRDGKKFGAVEFALELGLYPIFQYLARVRTYCSHMVNIIPVLNAHKDSNIPSVIVSYAMENRLYTAICAIFPDKKVLTHLKEPAVNNIPDLIADYVGALPDEQQGIGQSCVSCALHKATGF